MNTERKNRIIVFSALACFSLLMALLTILSPAASHDLLNRPSTYYTDKTGAKGLWMILQEFLPSVTQWRKPFAVVAGHQHLSPDIDTLIVASPGRPLGPHETEALMEWIEQGGQLILALEEDWPISDQPLKKQHSWLNERRQKALQIKTEDTDPQTIKDGFLKRLELGFEVEQQSQHSLSGWLTVGADLPVYRIKSRETLTWEGAFEPFVIGENNEPLVINKPMGLGRILITGHSSMISNEAMMDSDNAVWWTRICHDWGTGRVAFDEYHHGFAERRGFTSLAGDFMHTPWGWFTLHAMLAGGLFMFFTQRRLGRIYEKPVTHTRETLKLLQARSSMLEQAQPTRLSGQWIAHTLALDLTQGGLNVPWKDWIQAQADHTQSTEVGKHWKKLIDQLTKLEQSPSSDEATLKQLSQTAATIQHFYRHEH